MNLKPDCKIYYADDDEDDRYLFASALNSIDSSLQLETFENGSTLLNALHQAGYECDVVFLDLNMPVKNGIDTLISLQDEISRKNLKIIVFSTSADPAVVQKTFDLHATLFVQKPTTYGELVSILRTVISVACDQDQECAFNQYKFNFQ